MNESLITAAVVAAAIALVGVIVSTVAPLRVNAVGVKQDRYAQAIGSLVAWFEFPYRIARRVDDKPETLAELTENAHDLQIALVTHQAWMAGDSRTIQRAYTQTVEWVKEHCQSAIANAWAQPTESLDMNIGDLGLDHKTLTDQISDLHVLLGLRFGWRRIRLVKRFKAWKKYR